MYRSKEKKLAEVMLGEAALRLLKGGSSLSAASLTEMLSMMKEQEKDKSRQQACLTAINDIHASLPQSGALTESNNVLHFLAAKGMPDDQKKH